ncbi:DUF484 family protein [Tepidimonas taiwanensis]|uniref:DUF484 family protein n=1 Tax=Tepidimonas taiwanensis TaxID=307486 RepID=A0A554XDX4_9BURK|nr:DUF484 family protein [Tepidimonas taiwanensis]MCX7692603.1 DUF484 family protein [Tepidimonas taiwanensis]MDM7462643.1 DUF484 family protein [Tepidimonas taiwanensis]TSE33964.1 hypothetical protein Ttaiw_00023 [Tepidimonas taiwanensis]UBQ05056.1 DUF484 family protein [Tepidimonas taiwanensis]
MNAYPPLPPITEDDIAQFLLHTPDFFERHAELLAAVQLTSPHTGRAISLQERQVEVLRERLRQLELRAAEMIRHGQDNTSLLERLHRWTCALLAVDDPARVPDAVTGGLAQAFDVPQVALKLWGCDARWADAPYAQGASDDARAFATSLQQPYCGPNPGLEAAQWLPDPAAAASIALLPLRRAADAPAFGLLVLASPDARRFQADAATDFLARIGELAAAALARLLPEPH